jgi:hypothetical protein
VLSAVTGWFARSPKPKADEREDQRLESGTPRNSDAGWQAELKARYRRRFRPPLGQQLHRFKPRGFPLILDEYVLREFLKMLAWCSRVCAAAARLHLL